MERITLFAEVILPVPLKGAFTYRVPHEWNEEIHIGCRVVVEFGKRRVLTGVIRDLHTNPPKDFQAKYLMELLEEIPSVTETQLKFWDWIAGYYMSGVGEVMQAALPSGLKLSSQSRIQLNPACKLGNETDLSEKESQLLALLETKDDIAYEDAQELLQVKNLSPILKSLIRRGAVILYEQVKEKYKPKTVSKIRLREDLAASEEAIKSIFDTLSRSPKQEECLLAYLSLSPVYAQPELNAAGVDKPALSERVSASALAALLEKGIFQQFEIIIPRFADGPLPDGYSQTLTAGQESALASIEEQFVQKDTVLFHGITGSGKTEIYIDLIAKAMQDEGQVLYLLPEIALTTQIVSRLKKVFGAKLGVYHSKFSVNERVEVWQGVLSGKHSVVVGARSAILLPFQRLKLVIVDEEHEASYKQYDPAPRYNARDLALVLARFFEAKVLLGSATPSVESIYLAQKGVYGKTELLERYGNARPPEIELVDLKKIRLMKKMKDDFSPQMLEAIQDRLDKKEQIIIFQNRRGFANYLSCKECSWIPSCENCSVSLTYHLQSNDLKCHYCGHKESVPYNCSSCGSPQLRTVGMGTEKLEDGLKNFFPNALIQRMDLDTTRAKNSYENIIGDFENRKTDILVGTQMVSKGLDFDNVSLVGVFDIDRMLFFPDFRAFERCFQLVVQVSGRAGRKDIPGKVLVQTANTQHPLLQMIVENDFEQMYERELFERKKFGYPPFARLSKITLKHTDKEVVEGAAKLLHSEITVKLGPKRALGPEAPLIDKIRGEYLMDIYIKVERESPHLKAVKSFVQERIDALYRTKEYKQVKVSVDVDCM